MAEIQVFCFNVEESPLDLTFLVEKEVIIVLDPLVDFVFAA